MRIQTGSPIDPALFGFTQTEFCRPISGISTDSREVRPGDLFVALPGERSDGAVHLPEAFDRGAALILSHREENDPRVLFVPDPLAALTCAAAAYSAKIPHRTVAITGSYGKTTLRHNLTSILGAACPVACTEGNGNTDLALALTLLSMPRNTRILAAELGMRGRGEISRLSRLVKPDVAAITGIGSAHIGLLGSKEAICRAKCEIVDGMDRDGALIYPASDPYLARAVDALPVSSVTVSTDPAFPAAYALALDEIKDGKATVSLFSPGGEIRGVTLPGCDRAILSCAVFCFAVSEKLGIDRALTRAGLENLSLPPLRRQTETIGGATVILDCYNASPEPTEAALISLLRVRSSGKRIFLVLGDMLELGASARELHRMIGRRAAELSPKRLYCVGPLAREYGVGAMEKGFPEAKIREYFPDQIASIAGELAEELSPGDVLFVKGSRALKLETIVPYLKEAVR